MFLLTIVALLSFALLVVGFFAGVKHAEKAKAVKDALNK